MAAVLPQLLSLSALCRPLRAASFLCLGQGIQVFHILLWLHLVYFLGRSLGPVPPLGARPTQLLAATDASAMCVLWAAVSVPGLVEFLHSRCQLKGHGSQDV